MVEQYDAVRETRSVDDNNFVRAGVDAPPCGSPDRFHGDPGVEHCLLKRLLAEAIEPVGASAKWFGGTWLPTIGSAGSEREFCSGQHTLLP